jgi:hypothetical protein
MPSRRRRRIISNSVINLSVGKDRVSAEPFRVLRLAFPPARRLTSGLTGAPTEHVPGRLQDRLACERQVEEGPPSRGAGWRTTQGIRSGFRCATKSAVASVRSSARPGQSPKRAISPSDRPHTAPTSRTVATWLTACSAIVPPLEPPLQVRTEQAAVRSGRFAAPRWSEAPRSGALPSHVNTITATKARGISTSFTPRRGKRALACSHSSALSGPPS